MTGEMLMVIEGCHHLVAKIFTRKIYQNAVEVGWEWTLVEEALEVAGLWTIKE